MFCLIVVYVANTDCSQEHTSRGQFIAIEFTLNILGVVIAYWMELYVLFFTVSFVLQY
jgi:hypothetical protein